MAHASVVHARVTVLGLSFLTLALPAIALAGGSQSYAPGTYTFSVPEYGALTVQVWGGGGGGEGGFAGINEGNGGGGGGYTAATFSSGQLPGSVTVTVGAGGSAGFGGYPDDASYASPSELNPGSGGTSSFGSYLYAYGGVGGYYGGALSYGGSYSGGMGESGGTGAGAAGGYCQYDQWGDPYYCAGYSTSCSGAGGGWGGYPTIPGTPGGSSSCGGNGGAGGTGGGQSGTSGSMPGGGGGGGGQYGNSLSWGGSGAPGEVIISWTSPPAPTCSVSLSPNPSSYAYSGTPVTLSWSSTYSDEVYINNIGWVGSSGSAHVASQSSANYSCYGWSSGYGSGSWNSATLTVNPPSTPNATISASSSSIQVGQSTNILATYNPGSGDALTCTDISYYPSGAGGLVGPCTPFNKTYQFTSTSTGTVTFYAAAKTDYYTTWNTYAHTSVTVTQNPPLCTLSASPSSITQGGNSTLTWSCSSGSPTSCTGNNFSTGGATTGTTQVSPLQTTTYAGSCTGPGGTGNFTGNSQVRVSCQQSWSCSGQTIVQTNTDCSTTNLATCAAPQFCQAGSNICLAPTISFNPSGNLTGHLQATPNILRPGETTQLYWNVSGAQSCSVTGSNGNSWSGLASPQNGESSKPLRAQTTYTLACQGYSDATPPSVTETVQVDMTPTFKED